MQEWGTVTRVAQGVAPQIRISRLLNTGHWWGRDGGAYRRVGCLLIHHVRPFLDFGPFLERFPSVMHACSALRSRGNMMGDDWDE
jgi:hypothetical protein